MLQHIVAENNTTPRYLKEGKKRVYVTFPSSLAVARCSDYEGGSNRDPLDQPLWPCHLGTSRTTPICGENCMVMFTFTLIRMMRSRSHISYKWGPN